VSYGRSTTFIERKEVTAMSKGWISTDRALENHWIYSSNRDFRWWWTMLARVNHTYEPQKFSLGNSIYYINRGQAAYSLGSWVEIFDNGEKPKYQRKAVKSFFNKLEKDGMIKYEILGKGNSSSSLITITNYDDYQGGEEQVRNNKGTTKGIQYNNVNNDNNSSMYKTDSTTADRFKDADKTFSSIDAYNMFIEDLKEGVYALKTDSLKKAYKYDSESLGTEIERFKHHSIDMDTRYDNSMGYYRHLSNYIKNKHNK